MHIRLFNRPLLFTVTNPDAPMWIDGSYEEYVAGERYEGRVQINGSQGFCRVEVLSSNLPPAASVTVDNVNKEVVVRWAAYSPPTETVTEIPNGSFAEGPAEWEGMVAAEGQGPVFHNTGYGPEGNPNNAAFQNLKGDATILGAWAGVTDINRTIKLEAVLEQGKSSKGNAGAAMSLSWYDINRKLIRKDTGDFSMSGGEQKWQPISIEATAADPLVYYVRPGVVFRRKKQNHRVHVSNVKWNHSYERGYDSDEELFVEVRVTDGANNTATHRGIIEEKAIWFTTKPYPAYQYDSLLALPDIVRLDLKEQPVNDDSLSAIPSIVNITLADGTVKYNIDESLVATPSITTITLRGAPRQDQPPESLLATPGIGTISIKQNPSTAQPPESLLATPSIIGVTLV